MKYTQGNITANISEAYMKSTDRETFIADNKHTGLNDANLGKYWDLVNKEQIKDIIGSDTIEEFEAIRATVNESTTEEELKKTINEAIDVFSPKPKRTNKKP